jgi:hypothetical protein
VWGGEAKREARWEVMRRWWVVVSLVLSSSMLLGDFGGDVEDVERLRGFRLLLIFGGAPCGISGSDIFELELSVMVVLDFDDDVADDGFGRVQGLVFAFSGDEDVSDLMLPSLLFDDSVASDRRSE